MLDGVEFNSMQFIGPLILLFLVPLGIAFIYRLLFSWLPRKLYNALIGPVILLGLYIWAIPMNLGFHTYFK